MSDLKIKAAIKLLDEAIRLLDIAYVDHCATAERESLPLMARREWRESVAFATVNQGAITGVFDRYDAAARSATHHRACIYRIADTDEHGLPVIPREPGMPEGARYRGWTESTQRWSYYTRYIKRHAHDRFERIEDYRESGQEVRG